MARRGTRAAYPGPRHQDPRSTRVLPPHQRRTQKPDSASAGELDLVPPGRSATAGFFPGQRQPLPGPGGPSTTQQTT